MTLTAIIVTIFLLVIVEVVAVVVVVVVVIVVDAADVAIVAETELLMLEIAKRMEVRGGIDYLRKCFWRCKQEDTTSAVTALIVDGGVVITRGRGK